MMKVKRGKKKKKKKKKRRRKKRRSELGPYQLVEALGNQPIECMPNLKLSIKMNSLGCSAIIKRLVVLSEIEHPNSKCSHLR